MIENYLINQSYHRIMIQFGTFLNLSKRASVRITCLKYDIPLHVERRGNKSNISIKPINRFMLLRDTGIESRPEVSLGASCRVVGGTAT